jgi:hypothetical protein
MIKATFKYDKHSPTIHALPLRMIAHYRLLELAME